MSRAAEANCDGLQPGTLLQAEPLGDDANSITASRALISNEEDFEFGRALYERAIAVPDGGTALYVSTIYSTYLDGGTFPGPGVRQDCIGSSTLGYRHPSNEVQLVTCMEPPIRIAGFCLAQDLRGVRRLSVIWDDGALSNWVGDHEGIPQRRLVLSPHERDIVKFLKGGFDALKLVSLSVSAVRQSGTGAGVSLTDRDRTLWFPAVPQSHLKFVGMQHWQAEANKGRLGATRNGGHVWGLRGPISTASV
ncbi:hypothetical protein N657DRAFT_318839 [Parathielavia appendiculata]|uniref:DUF7600 domain-containing protein n=1 Tax=Parathielavia appendiculata TaxID=2587402 RepID=A0AAN6YYS8_9PEZI|nr:hypothetical protein N657DRAFT_318839 [Parathielavia appendiculata]